MSGYEEPHKPRRSARIATRTPVFQSEQQSTFGDPSGSSMDSNAVDSTLESYPNPSLNHANESKPGHSRKTRTRKKQSVRPASRRLPSPRSAETPSSSEESNPAVMIDQVRQTLDTTVEYLLNVLKEHEEKLWGFPKMERTLAKYKKMREHYKDFEERFDSWSNEIQRLRSENQRLVGEIQELKDVHLKFLNKMDDIERISQSLPPKYRRKDDPRGRPFEKWRRYPDTIPQMLSPWPIDTVMAEQVDRKKYRRSELVIPASRNSGSPSSSDVTLTAVNQQRVEIRGLKRPREDDHEPCTKRVNVLGLQLTSRRETVPICNKITVYERPAGPANSNELVGATNSGTIMDSSRLFLIKDDRKCSSLSRAADNSQKNTGLSPFSTSSSLPAAPA